MGASRCPPALRARRAHEQLLVEERDRLHVAQLEVHLAECEPCRAHLATYRRTVGVVVEAGKGPMPDELRRRLKTFLLERLHGGRGARPE